MQMLVGDLGLVWEKLIWRRRSRGSKALVVGPVPGLVLEVRPVSSMVLVLEAGPVPRL